MTREEYHGECLKSMAGVGEFTHLDRNLGPSLGVTAAAEKILVGIKVRPGKPGAITNMRWEMDDPSFLQFTYVTNPDNGDTPAWDDLRERALARLHECLALKSGYLQACRPANIRLR